jgi:O-antigen ligase
MQFLSQYRSRFEKILVGLLLLIAFLLPMERRLVVPLLAVFCAVWILHGNLKHKVSAVFTFPVLILSVVFYLLHVVGMLYSENIKTGLSHLEVKFSLLLFPFLLAGIKDVLANNFNKITWAFIFGNITAAVICFAVATYAWVTTGANHFYYNDFSIFNLPTYSSMYLLFCMAALFYFLTVKHSVYSIKTKWLFIVCILFFALVVFLNHSRGAILSGVVAVAFSGAFYFVKKKKWLWLLVSLILPVFIGAGLFMYHPRFESLRAFVISPPDSLPSSSEDNVTIRYMVAKQSLQLAKENFWLGTGTGDVKDQLMKKYTSLNMVMAEHEHLNAHNQFLETFVGLGIVGLLLLLLLVLEPVYSGIRQTHILKIAFGLIVTINFLFESMLNTEAGVIFYALFWTLLAVCFPLAGKRTDNVLN